MPAMGPSRDEAYAQGEQAFNELMVQLKAKYNISPQGWRSPFAPLQETRQKVLDDLKLAIQEVIWQDHCESF